MVIHGPRRNINACSVHVGVKICSRSIQSSEGINYTQIELCFTMGRVEAFPHNKRKAETNIH